MEFCRDFFIIHFPSIEFIMVSEKDAAEKKRILTDEYGMVMTAELEGRIQVMCNWSESIEARGFEKGIIKERIADIERMIKANATKAQIISYGYC